MSFSLKGYTPTLAGLLSTTPAALYERQRALVRAGLLDAGDGRGPGSGVRATAPSTALLLLSVLATEHLSETERRVSALAMMRPARSTRCPFTEMTTFVDAFAVLLSQLAKAALVSEVKVSRTADRAQILFRDLEDNRKPKISEFVGANSKEPAIAVVATLGAQVLLRIAKDVRGAFEDAPAVVEHVKSRRRA